MVTESLPLPELQSLRTMLSMHSLESTYGNIDHSEAG